MPATLAPYLRRINYNLPVRPDLPTLIGVHRSGAIVIWDLATGRPVHRIGGRTRELGSCDDVAAQPFFDDAHRAIVTRACTLSPGEHAARVHGFTHLRIDDNLDAVLDWGASAPLSRAAP